MPILNSRHAIIVATLFSLTLLGAGCGATSPTINTETGTINVQGQNGNMLSGGENAQIPANFPAIYPRYPGAKTTLAYTERNGSAGSLAQETSDSFAQVQTWVESTMQSQGFTKDNAFTSPNVVILTFTKGTTHCQINVAAQSGATHIQSACAEQTN